MKDYSKMSDYDLAKAYQEQVQIMARHSASLFRDGTEKYYSAKRKAAAIREEIDRRLW
jgi:hypothetical protein